jgi:predicted lipid-binding transport protein (Tim44 family)
MRPRVPHAAAVAAEAVTIIAAGPGGFFGGMMGGLFRR